MFSVLIATCSSDLIATLRGGPYSAVTQLRVNPLCKPSFLEVRLAQGGDFLGANSCPPTFSHSPWECIYLSLVPRTWFSLGMALLMGRICPRVSQRWRGYFTSQVTPYWYYDCGLEATFFFLFVAILSCQGGPCPPCDVLTWLCLILVMPLPGDAFLRRCLYLATPFLGDAFARRRLSQATPLRGDAFTWRCPKRSTC